MLHSHPRTEIVADARHEIIEAILKSIRKHDLTYTELWSILANELAGWAKYAIRAERHPDDSGKGGDEA